MSSAQFPTCPVHPGSLPVACARYDSDHCGHCEFHRHRDCSDPQCKVCHPEAPTSTEATATATETK